MQNITVSCGRYFFGLIQFKSRFKNFLFGYVIFVTFAQL